MADQAILDEETTDNDSLLCTLQLLTAQALLKFAWNEKVHARSLLGKASSLSLKHNLYFELESYDYEPAHYAMLTNVLWELWMCDITFAALQSQARTFLQLSVDDILLRQVLYVEPDSWLENSVSASIQSRCDITDDEEGLLECNIRFTGCIISKTDRRN